MCTIRDAPARDCGSLDRPHVPSSACQVPKRVGSVLVLAGDVRRRERARRSPGRRPLRPVRRPGRDQQQGRGRRAGQPAGRARDPAAARPRPTVCMANGKVLANFYDENRIYVPLNKIAPVMRQAQVAIEDHRYYEHGALDLNGTLRALVRNSTSDDGTQGGSSITQQYVKMVQIEACQTKGARTPRSRRASTAARAPDAGAQDPGAALRDRAGEAAQQGPDPRATTSTSPTTATARTASRPRPSTTSTPRRPS